MAYDHDLAQRIRSLLEAEPGLDEREMFGGLVFMLEGNMAVGVMGDELIVRAGDQRALEEPHTREFDITGRPMKRWVVVAPEALDTDEGLLAWVDRGVDYARTLPPK